MVYHKNDKKNNNQEREPHAKYYKNCILVDIERDSYNNNKPKSMIIKFQNGKKLGWY